MGRSQQPSLLYPYKLSGPEPLPGRRPVPTLDIDLGTTAYMEWPENHLAGEIWRRGEVPLWDAHQAAGVPFLAQYSSRILFPYQILEDLSPTWTWDFFLLGRAWIAGLFTWAVLRRLLGSTPSALLGGALYMLSGTFTWFLNLEQYANVAMVAPALLYAVDHIAVDRRSSNAALVAVATALVLLGGQPETAFFALAYGGFWTLFRAVSLHGREGARNLAWYFAGSALGILLAAPLLIPFAEYASHAFHIHPAGGSMGVRSPTPWSYLPGIWLPNLFQQPAYPVDLPLNGRWDYLGGFSGVLPWVLVLAAFARGRTWRREIAFTAGGAALVLLKNLGVPPFAWIGHLPVFDQVWTPRWAGPIWVLSLALAAGFAAQSLLAGSSDQTPPLPKPWLFRLALLALVACALRAAWAFCFDHPELPREQFLPTLPDAHFASRAAVAVLVAAITLTLSLWISLRRAHSRRAGLALLALAMGELALAVPRGYGSAWLNAGVIPSLFCTATAVALVFGRVRFAALSSAAVGVSLAVIDLTSPRGLPPRRDPFTPAPWVTYVRARAGHHRVTSIGGVLFPNYASAVGLYDVHYIVALGVSAFHDMSMWMLEPSRSPSHRAWGVGMWLTGVPEGSYLPNGLAPAIANMQRAARIYAMFGVRYVATPRNVRLDVPITHGDEATAPPYRLVYGAEVNVWEHTAVLPRAWIVHEVRRARSMGVTFSLLGRADLDLQRTAVLNDEVGTDDLVLSPTAAPPDERERVRITEYLANRVTLSAQTTAPGLLILSDVFSEGWDAEIDGRGVVIHRVNGCLRGVWVQPGAHRIVYRYRPESFRIGLLFAGAAALICLLLSRQRAPSDRGEPVPSTCPRRDR